MPPNKKTAAGLRERKKAKTIAAVQQHALRLFRENGYQETTVEQIAEAAEISQSTFFRYFKTKEDVLIIDNYDPIMIEEFKKQPAELSPLAAVRNALLAGVAYMSAEETKTARERIEVMMSIPELRAASANNMFATMNMIAEMVAERLGVTSDDWSVRVLAGAVVGACSAVLLHYAEHPEAEFAELLQDALNKLESGLAF
ncbi:TetR family transcriptional regulator [Paenibacillus sp. GCM10027626]|uniref:acyl-CoA-like ligand-binding transcription factor n=1 Tax=Paenibacillus sp. GCM10027626 TaxID=3273411 RepID=UPI00363949A0